MTEVVMEHKKTKWGAFRKFIGVVQELTESGDFPWRVINGDALRLELRLTLAHSDAGQAAPVPGSPVLSVVFSNPERRGETVHKFTGEKVRLLLHAAEDWNPQVREILKKAGTYPRLEDRLPTASPSPVGSEILDEDFPL
jgi:hypothetical protein